MADSKIGGSSWLPSWERKGRSERWKGVLEEGRRERRLEVRGVDSLWGFDLGYSFGSVVKVSVLGSRIGGDVSASDVGFAFDENSSGGWNSS